MRHPRLRVAHRPRLEEGAQLDARLATIGCVEAEHAARVAADAVDQAVAAYERRDQLLGELRWGDFDEHGVGAEATLRSIEEGGAR